MLASNTPRRRLAKFAVVCLVTIALPAAPAWAQKTKNKHPAPVAAASSSFTVEIPTIEAVDSNVDEATLRDIFSGKIVENAAVLAGLTATSITIPEIKLAGSSLLDGVQTEGTIVFNDIVLSNVTDGIAETITLGSTSTDSQDTNVSLGETSASNFNIGGVLGMYGLVDGSGQTQLETIYTDLAFDGGTIATPDVQCTIGAANVAEFKARPLNHSVEQIMALASAMEQNSDPDPKLLGDFMRMYVDMLTAFQTSPVHFDGFDCAGQDEQDRAVSFSVAGLDMSAITPGDYPSFSVDGVNIGVDKDGSVSFGNFTIKGMDLTGPIAAIEAAPEAIDEAWLAENGRALIPAFEGFSFADVAVDMPNPDLPSQRIVGGIGGFDLTLGSYRNGIPTAINSSATHITADIPADTQDEQLAQLLALGVTSIDVGFSLDAAWNEAKDQIDINDISVTGVDLATVKLAGTIANVTETVFGLDLEAAFIAASKIAIANLKLDILDQGLSDLIIAQVATEQGTDPATLRTVYAGLAQGSIVSILAGAADAQKLGAAINSFTSGKAKSLMIDMTAKAAEGLSLDDFYAAQLDPASLIDKVTIEATAK